MAYTRRSAFLTASEVGIRLITLSIRLITLSSAADRSIADLMITPRATDQWGRANTGGCRLNLAPISTHAVFRSQLLSLALKSEDQIHPEIVHFCLGILQFTLGADMNLNFGWGKLTLSPSTLTYPYHHVIEVAKPWVLEKGIQIR